MSSAGVLGRAVEILAGRKSQWPQRLYVLVEHLLEALFQGLEIAQCRILAGFQFDDSGYRVGRHLHRGTLADEWGGNGHSMGHW